MFYVNDDDIEGLFRTAAENYDINAEQAADFNGVLKALHEEEGSEAQKPEKKKGDSLFSGGLLFCLLLVCSYGILHCSGIIITAL